MIMSTWPISTIHLSMPTNDAYQDANSAFKTGLVSISGSQFSLNGAGHTMALATYVLVHLLHTLPSNVYLRTSYILCSKLFTGESTQKSISRGKLVVVVMRQINFINIIPRV